MKDKQKYNDAVPIYLEEDTLERLDKIGDKLKLKFIEHVIDYLAKKELKTK